MCCHCLLIETPQGLVLVDTGLGTADVETPDARLGKFFRLAVRPKLLMEQTALKQVEALGFKRSDVRHIVPTHLDLDHAGGLSDFPDATVHIFQPEHYAATTRPTFQERHRYRTQQFAHGPKWKVHDVSGENWRGFDSIRALSAGADEILLVPTVGHTRGHCAIAVNTGTGWLLHCGDAYFFREEMNWEKPHCPPGLALFQDIVQMDGARRRDNQVRLRRLAHEHPHDLTLFSAHDPVELRRMQETGSPLSRG
jgi:glyoxylase-like metal-dependent hydrolase (beta-lactamase superfamily II)